MFMTVTNHSQLELADEFPACNFIGTDLSPIQPGWVPPNCKFYVDDFDQPWEFGDTKFDLVHARNIAGSTASFPALYAQAFQYLRPGGWLEVQDYDAWMYSDDGSVEKAPWIRTWISQMDEMTIKYGRRLDVAKYQKKLLEEAGFVDVKEEVYKVRMVPLILLHASSHMHRGCLIFY